MTADTPMRQTTSEENTAAVRDWQRQHNTDAVFNGITFVALDEKYGGCIHVPGRGFFVPQGKETP